MHELKFSFAATILCKGRAHVGVVSSGDLEVLMQAAHGARMNISITTSVAGYDAIWEATLQRFNSRNSIAADIRIHDFGATPGMVLLRLQQALDSLETPDA